MSILAHRLVRIIETHSKQLTQSLQEKILRSDRCSDYHNISGEEVQNLVGEVYRHLGEWLVAKTEHDIERRYTAIGERRAEQGVPVSQLCWCIALVKENLWEYLRENEVLENTSEIYAEMEMLQLVDQFFDRAMYYAIRGHERVTEARLAATTTH